MPTVPEVMPHVLSVYSRHCAGCCLHIVTDDGNVRDSDVEYCLERALDSGHLDCITAAEMLRLMTRTQRLKVYRARKVQPTPLTLRPTVAEVNAAYESAGREKDEP